MLHVLKSHFGYEVSKINIYEDRFLVASTVETLLMGDLETCKLSEVPWAGSGSEKYHFDNPQVCAVPRPSPAPNPAPDPDPRPDPRPDPPTSAPRRCA